MCQVRILSENSTCKLVIFSHSEKLGLLWIDAIAGFGGFGGFKAIATNSERSMGPGDGDRLHAAAQAERRAVATGRVSEESQSR